MLKVSICFHWKHNIKKIKLTRPNAPTHYQKVVGFTEGFGFSQITYKQNIKYSLVKVIVC